MTLHEENVLVSKLSTASCDAFLLAHDADLFLIGAGFELGAQADYLDTLRYP